MRGCKIIDAREVYPGFTTKCMYTGHWAIDFDDDIWIALNEEHGREIGRGRSKDAAIADANRRLNLLSK